MMYQIGALIYNLNANRAKGAERLSHFDRCERANIWI